MTRRDAKGRFLRSEFSQTITRLPRSPPEAERTEIQQMRLADARRMLGRDPPTADLAPEDSDTAFFESTVDRVGAIPEAERNEVDRMLLAYAKRMLGLGPPIPPGLGNREAAFWEDTLERILALPEPQRDKIDRWLLDTARATLGVDPPPDEPEPLT